MVSGYNIECVCTSIEIVGVGGTHVLKLLIFVSGVAAQNHAIVQLYVGLDKICLAKFEQNGQPKERSNSASKMGCQFCQKSKMGRE